VFYELYMFTFHMLGLHKSSCKVLGATQRQ